MQIKLDELKPLPANAFHITDWYDFKEILQLNLSGDGTIVIDKVLELAHAYDEDLMARENPYAFISKARLAEAILMGIFKDDEWTRWKAHLSSIPKGHILSFSELNCFWTKEESYGDILRAINVDSSLIVPEEEIQVILRMVLTAESITQSPFYYIESIGITELNKKDYAYINIFIEPCGHVVIYGKTILEVAEAWDTIFKGQPKDMNYAAAGWRIFGHNNDLLTGEEDYNIVGETIDPASFWEPKGEQHQEGQLW